MVSRHKATRMTAAMISVSTRATKASKRWYMPSTGQSRRISVRLWGSRAIGYSSADRQHHSKPRLPAHHAIVRFGGPLQRKRLIHRPHPGAGTEDERILRVDRRAGIPALDRAAAAEQG